jgi:hypothetical protein
LYGTFINQPSPIRHSASASARLVGDLGSAQANEIPIPIAMIATIKSPELDLNFCAS